MSKPGNAKNSPQPLIKSTTPGTADQINPEYAKNRTESELIEEFSPMASGTPPKRIKAQEAGPVSDAGRENESER